MYILPQLFFKINTQEGKQSRQEKKTGLRNPGMERGKCGKLNQERTEIVMGSSSKLAP